MQRHLRPVHSFALFIAILVPDLALAAAAAPFFLGSFTSPGLCSPRGIALSPSGDVFVGSDCSVNPHMERFTGAGGLLGTWGFPAGYFGSPNGIALDGSSNVFVTDSFFGRVHKLTSSGALLTTWGSIGSGPGQFLGPADIVVDGSGDVFVSEIDGQRVQKFTNGGTYLATIGTAGPSPGQFQAPSGMGLDASGRLYVGDVGRLRVLRFLSDGSFDMEFATPTSPDDVAVGPDGNVYVVSFTGGSAVYQYSPGGALLQVFGSTGQDGRFRIAISPTGVIFITEQYGTRVSRFQIDRTTAARRTTFGRLKAIYR